MCDKCMEIVNKYYSHLSEVEKMGLLLCATGFPLVSPERVEIQLKELIENTDGTLGSAIAFAERKMDEA